MAKKLSKYDSVTEAVASGDQVEMLKAQTDALAVAIDTCETPRDLAALHNRLTHTLTSLRELDPPKKQTSADKRRKEAAERRAKAEKEETST